MAADSELKATIAEFDQLMFTAAQGTERCHLCDGPAEEDTPSATTAHDVILAVNDYVKSDDCVRLVAQYSEHAVELTATATLALERLRAMSYAERTDTEDECVNATFRRAYNARVRLKVVQLMRRIEVLRAE